MAINQGIFDEILDSALNVFRLAARERNATIARLEALERELVGRLAAEAVTTRQKRRVETFLKETGKLIDQRYKQLQLELDFSGLGRTIAVETVTAFQIVLGLEALSLPPAEYFRSLESDVMIMGAPSADWWRGQSEDLKRRFGQQVRQGLSGAETNQQIISRIVGKNGQPGIMETARRNAAALVQTSVQTVANDARRNTFLANPDVISGLRQVSTLDGHTSVVCISYSGAEWDLEYQPIHGNTLPFNGGCPRHFNCRSLEIPITRSFAEMGLDIPEPRATSRASSEGQIDANTSFDAFLRRRGQAYQDRMLGEGRADLWRKGRITLRDLVDGNGRPLSLAELQARVARKSTRR